jgi:hypothetical protein
MGFQLLHDPGLVSVSATLAQDQSLDAARDAIYKAVEDVIKNPPTSVRVDRVTSQLLRGLENNLSNPQAIATGALNTPMRTGRLAAHVPAARSAAGRHAADVVRVAQTYFKPSNRTVGYYIPDATPDRTSSPRRRTLAETFTELHGTGPSHARESFDPTIRTSSRASSAPARERHEGRRPVQEDRQQHPSPPRSICGSATRRRWRAAEAASLRRRPADGRNEEPTRASRCRGTAQVERAVSTSSGGGGGGGGGGGAAAAGRRACPARRPASLRPPRISSRLCACGGDLQGAGVSRRRFRSDQAAAPAALELPPTEPNQLRASELTAT